MRLGQLKWNIVSFGIVDMFLGSIAAKSFRSYLEVASRVSELDVGKDCNGGTQYRLWDELNSFTVHDLAEVAQPIAKVNLSNACGVDMVQEVHCHQDISMSIIRAMSVATSSYIASAKGMRRRRECEDKQQCQCDVVRQGRHPRLCTRQESRVTTMMTLVPGQIGSVYEAWALGCMSFVISTLDDHML
jgi:hypothetical protein